MVDSYYETFEDAAQHIAHNHSGAIHVVTFSRPDIAHVTRALWILPDGSFLFVDANSGIYGIHRTDIFEKAMFYVKQSMMIKRKMVLNDTVLGFFSKEVSE